MPEQQHQQRGGAPGGGGQFISEPTQIGLPWRLMVFTFILFLFSIFVYVGLKFGYNAYLDSQIEAVDSQIEELAAQVSEDEQDDFLSFYSQVVNLRSVLDRRNFSQNNFEFLESRTIPAVYYQNVEYVGDSFSLLLTGRTNSMESFVNQMQVFDDSSEVDSAVVEDVSVEQDGVRFSLQLSMSPDFLNQPQTQVQTQTETQG